MARLTKRSIDALDPRGSDYFVWDDEIKGFGVRVLPSGRKTFVAQYRSGGVQRRVKLGIYGAVTPDQARIRARQTLGEVAGGGNPAEAIRIHRRAPTVAAVCDRFLNEYVVQRCKPTTQREYTRSVALFIKPAFGPRKIGDIVRTDVAALHHRMRHIPYQANRTLGVLSKMFNLAEVWGLRPDGSNPCRHVMKYKERKRERYLNKDELARLGRILDEIEAEGSESTYAIAAVRLLVLTGCRLSEIQTLKWSYVEAGYLHLPDTKTGPRKVPLPSAVKMVLESLPRGPETEYIIAGTVPGQHLTDLQRPWRRIRARAGLEGVRIHDLRHTYASNALAAGLSLPMVGKLLGHTQYQTTMRYAHLADEPVREAATQVSSQVAQLMSNSKQRPRPDLKVVT